MSKLFDDNYKDCPQHNKGDCEIQPCFTYDDEGSETHDEGDYGGEFIYHSNCEEKTCPIFFWAKTISKEWTKLNKETKNHKKPCSGFVDIYDGGIKE